MSTGAKGSPRLAVLNLLVYASVSLVKAHPISINFLPIMENLQIIEPVTPAVTCSAQATYLTGKTPSERNCGKWMV